jgi:hypothetical protein
MRFFSFVDPNFLANPKRGAQIAREIKARGMDVMFEFATRPDIVNKNMDAISELMKVGCVHVEVGIESLSQETLEKWKRNMEIDAIHRAIIGMDKMGMNYTVTLIMFHPDATIEEIKKNLSFIRQHDIGERVYDCFNSLKIFPGTSINPSETMKNCKMKDNRVARLYRTSKEVYDLLYQMDQQYKAVVKAVRKIINDKPELLKDVLNVIPSYLFVKAKEREMKLCVLEEMLESVEKRTVDGPTEKAIRDVYSGLLRLNESLECELRKHEARSTSIENSNKVFIDLMSSRIKLSREMDILREGNRGLLFDKRSRNIFGTNPYGEFILSILQESDGLSYPDIINEFISAIPSKTRKTVDRGRLVSDVMDFLNSLVIFGIAHIV